MVLWMMIVLDSDVAKQFPLALVAQRETLILDDHAFVREGSVSQIGHPMFMSGYISCQVKYTLVLGAKCGTDV